MTLMQKLMSMINFVFHHGEFFRSLKVHHSKVDFAAQK